MKQALFKTGALLAAVTLLAGMPQKAEADWHSRAHANLHAGPGFGYPVITAMDSAAPVEVMGCLQDWSWCDVSWNGDRGWVPGNALLADVPRRTIIKYHENVPVVVFERRAYWDDHYPGEPFYGHWRHFFERHGGW